MIYFNLKNKKNIIFIIIIVVFLLSYIVSSKTIYGEWLVTDWGSVVGEKRIDSIDDLEGNGITISNNTVNVGEENDDPYLYIDTNDAKYL